MIIDPSLCCLLKLLLDHGGPAEASTESEEEEEEEANPSSFDQPIKRTFPLVHAVANGYTACVDLLLAAGASMRHCAPGCDFDERRLLVLARTKEFWDIVCLLEKYEELRKTG